MNERVCANCVWAHKFKPRPDEIERGLTMGCKYKNYEGYTKPDATCRFFSPAHTQSTGGSR